jgi:hypothetical protein
LQTESERQEQLVAAGEKELSRRERLLNIKPKPIQLPTKASV